MTNPERFRTSGSDLQRQLFASMEDDAPPPGAQARMLAALGAVAVFGGTESAAAAAAGKGAPGLGWVVIAKWMAAGAAAAFVTVGTGVAVSSRARSTQPAPVTTARANTTAARPTHTAVSTENRPLGNQDRTEREAFSEAREHAVATSPQVRVRASASANEAETPRASAAVVSTTPPSDLAREVAILDDVQKTLDRGDPRGALWRLDLYSATFPTPSLGPEATLLRVQSLLASGDRPGAEALGRAFISRNPRSQHAERIQSLLAPAGRFFDQKSGAGTQRR